MEKRLYRSRKKKVVAGLCGGLGDYLDIDPVIIRIIFVLITIFHGIGLLIYIIMWIIVEEEPYDKSFAEAKQESYSESKTEAKSEPQENLNQTPKEETIKSSNGRIFVGVVLIIIGLVFLSERFFPFFDFEFVFALGLIGFGIALIVNFFNRPEKSS